MTPDQPPPTRRSLAALRNNKHLLFALMGLAGGMVGALVAELAPMPAIANEFLRYLLHTTILSAVFSSVLTVGLFWAGEIYHRKPGLAPKIIGKALLSGLLAGAIAGAVAQAVYSLPVELKLIQELVLRPACWGLMGALLGWRLGVVVPNLGFRRGVLGGAIGGFIGGYGFLAVNFLALPQTISRMVGVGILGLALGLAIIIVEALFREAFLEVIWAPNETTSVSLGERPVYIGGGDDQIFVPGLPQHAAGVVFEQGRVQYLDTASGQRTALQKGSKLQIGKIWIVVHAFK